MSKRIDRPKLGSSESDEFPAVNGEEKDSGKADTEAWQYSTDARQRDLGRRIAEQKLPVAERLNELENSLESCLDRKGIVLFQGETGSGKSIFSPSAVARVLKKRDLPARTIMLQPRKDACRGIARANAAVTGRKLGKEVGFSTSEEKAIDARTELNVVTPGIFLRYLMEGQLTKEKVGAFILDEIHEGTVDYHLIMGLVKMMHERGEAPLVLLTSATLNKERIQEYFGIDDEDYLKIEGRRYPVEVSYVSKQEVGESETTRRKGYMRLAADRVGRKCKQLDQADIDEAVATEFACCPMCGDEFGEGGCQNQEHDYKKL
ncbi:MAG: DEAD/DEAH box helicase, partial [Parcubacteria group bacterium]